MSFLLDLIGVISLLMSLSQINGKIVQGKSFPIYGLLSFGYRVIYIIRAINYEIGIIFDLFEKEKNF